MSARSKANSTGGVPLGKGRETGLGRRAGWREQHATTLIVTNGKSTERKYLRALRQEPWIRPGKIAVVFENGSPLEAVKASYKKRDKEDYDQVWVICDVDQYDTLEPSLEADEHDVSLVWSNPCFEVWLILHRDDCTGYLTNAEECRNKLRKLVRSWDKTRLDFKVFKDGVADAVRRAKALGSPPDANPSTDMWRLVEELRHEVGAPKVKAKR